MTKLERAYQLYNDAKLASVNRRLQAADCRAEAETAYWASERSIHELRAGKREEDAELCELEAEMYGNLIGLYGDVEFVSSLRNDRRNIMKTEERIEQERKGRTMECTICHEVKHVNEFDTCDVCTACANGRVKE